MMIESLAASLANGCATGSNQPFGGCTMYAGSPVPVNGGYGTWQYLNWACKFTIDSNCAELALT